jgi:hypothetical protein
MLRRDVELLPYQNVSDNASRKGYNVQYFNSGSVQLREMVRFQATRVAAQVFFARPACWFR